MRTSSSVLLGSALLGATAQASVVKVTVTAPHDAPEVPVSVIVSTEKLRDKVPNDKAERVTGQLEAAGEGKMRLTFLARDLKAGQARTFWVDSTVNASNEKVTVTHDGENVEFRIDGQLFTRYDTTTGPNKPYFYPLMAPGGGQIVRHWPIEIVGDETNDHPHHRGLWFTHGEVNGVDFWAETAKTGKTVNTGYGQVLGGPVFGLMQSRTAWIKPDGTTIATDARVVRVYPLQTGIVMDFSVTLTPVGGPLIFGDTKEGSFGLRVADSLRVAVEKGRTAQGHILNSQGDEDGRAWSKSAAWCDYYGPVDGKTVGVAIFDAPQNLRHPTTWHVRDYGLFAVNPFGLHSFDPKTPVDSGQFTLPADQTLTLKYRLFFHRGSTEEANVPQAWQAFDEPPVVTVD